MNAVKAKDGLSLSYGVEHFENILGTGSEFDMQAESGHVFQCRIFLTHLTARPKFYSSQRTDGKYVLAYLTRIKHVTADLRAIVVSIADLELCLAIQAVFNSNFST